MVLLTGAEESEVKQVLAEYGGSEISGSRLHQELQRRASEHQGHLVAIEWLGPRGWVRYLWCRK
jgi:hypothetical protein